MGRSEGEIPTETEADPLVASGWQYLQRQDLSVLTHIKSLFSQHSRTWRGHMISEDRVTCRCGLPRSEGEIPTETEADPLVASGWQNLQRQDLSVVTHIKSLFSQYSRTWRRSDDQRRPDRSRWRPCASNVEATPPQSNINIRPRIIV